MSPKDLTLLRRGYVLGYRAALRKCRADLHVLAADFDAWLMRRGYSPRGVRKVPPVAKQRAALIQPGEASGRSGSGRSRRLSISRTPTRKRDKRDKARQSETLQPLEFSHLSLLSRLKG